jgi:acetylornithine aminotransferase/acetylornithine/N-succinyldiaminopimelate aminotransferase
VLSPLGEVRGHGCLLGLKLDRPVKPVVTALRDQGYIVGGSDEPTVLRLMPPLTLPFETLDTFAQTLARTLSP